MPTWCNPRTRPERQRLRGIFRGLELEVAPVVCIRNEEDWRESWSTELQTWSDRIAHEFGDGRDDVRGDPDRTPFNNNQRTNSTSRVSSLRMDMTDLLTHRGNGGQTNTAG